MTGGVITLMSCKPLSDARMSLLWFQVVRLRDNRQTALWNFATWFFFMLCRFPLSRFIMHWQKNRINSFGQDWRRRLLHLWQNHWNTWRVERFFVFIVQSFDCFSRSVIKNIEGMDSVFVQKRYRSSVRGDKSINKRPKATDVASLYQSNSSEPRPDCVLRVVTCITSRGD